MPYKHIEISMGPQHPSTHGVLQLKVTADNEVVLNVEPVIGYLHRGMEKLWEHRTYPQIVPLTDRLDYLAGMNMNLGLALCVEKPVNRTLPSFLLMA